MLTYGKRQQQKTAVDCSAVLVRQRENVVGLVSGL